MKLTPLVSQVRTWCPVFAGRVAGALDWDPTADSAKLPVPSAYVIMTGDDADDAPLGNVIRQDIRDEFDVCVVLAQADERGQTAADTLHDVRAELWRALVGYQPSPELEPIQYGGGSLVLINRDRVVYRFGFFAEFQLGRNLASEPAETWQERQLDGLPTFTEVKLDLDAIDPMADRNLQYPGPDGRIEVQHIIPLENL